MIAEPWTDSRTPALAIVARGDQIAAVSSNEFRVRSQSHPDQEYTVTVERNRWACTCLFSIQGGGRMCVHVLAVKLRAGLQETAPAVEAAAGPRCGKCQSSDVIAWGRRANKRGAVRRFRCKTCGATVSGKEGFQRRRADPDTIAKALDLYFRGSSFRQVAEHFRQAYNLPISAMCVYRWVVSYGKAAAEWMDRQGAKVGDKWAVDERVINVNGEHRYLWHVMDTDTRFLLATAVSKARSFPETRLPFERAKAATDVRPTEVRSDGMKSYPWAVKVEFGEGVHRHVEGIKAVENNNRLERLNGTSKDRTKTMRAYDGDKGAAALSEAWRAHYDMVKTHLALKTTPGLAAGLPDLGTFRWRTLIELAATNRIVTPDGGEAGPTD